MTWGITFDEPGKLELPDGYVAVDAGDGRVVLAREEGYHCYQCLAQCFYLFPDGRGGCCTRVMPEEA